jgi:hypothetical protein
MKNEKLYGISYHHKFITIYNDLEIIFKDIVFGNSNEELDSIIAKYVGAFFNYKEVQINLSEYFQKGFFYKGLLWDRDWRKEISVVRKVKFVNDLLRIKIENLTYPHSGYVLLDIEKNAVLEAKKL